MRLSFIIVLLLFAAITVGQTNNSSAPTYPQNYFRNPLDIPIFLAGNFGECRPGHFHSGLDIKTLGEENQPVHAAADGYVSRIKMEKGGFGHALYLTHPNGYTTLYAHLSTFAPEIQNYVMQQQYELQRWDVDISLTPDDFPVVKGQQIALSGNTGGSTAPHLHFEIRNSKNEHPVNPELFGFPITDRVSPIPLEVFIYSGNIYEDSILAVKLASGNSYCRPTELNIKSHNVVDDTIDVWDGLTGLGVNVDDFMDSSTNTLAPYKMRLFMDEQLQSEITLDNIGYDETRYINGYADYRTHELEHKWSQLLFQLPGNKLDGVYTHQNSIKGRLDFRDKKIHLIRIECIDDWQNTCTVQFYAKPVFHYEPKALPQNTLLFNADKPNSYSNPNLQFSLDSRQLYESFFFEFGQTKDNTVLSERFMLHHSYIPIHHTFELRIKPTKAISFALRSKVALMYSNESGKEDGRVAVFGENGWYKANVRALGNYWLEIDTIPPVIKSLQKQGANLSKANQITFLASDDKSSIKRFSGYLDGKWICFEQHENSFFYKFDEHCSKGKHELLFKAEDENSNEQTFKLMFTR